MEEKHNITLIDAEVRLDYQCTSVPTYQIMVITLVHCYTGTLPDSCCTINSKVMSNLKLVVGFLAVLLILGTTDALLTIEESPFTTLTADQVIEPTQPTEPAVEPGGVKKISGPNVDEVLAEMEFTVRETSESMLLSQVIQEDGSKVTEVALLKDGDRAGVLAWTESPKVKIYYLALKEALHSSFTPAVTDLVDETQRIEGKPPRNFLTFMDTGISEERIVFMRVRERLYEIHIAKNSDDVVFELIDLLTN